MAGNLISTKELVGLRVVAGRPSRKDPEATHRIGKVRACVFHPHDKRFVGVIVKRPDAAMMFHRKDLFVAYNGYELVDGRLLVHADPEATDKAACRAMGIDWDECVLWVGLPVTTRGGSQLGLVGDVVFDRRSGAVESLEVTAGATANALLGKRVIPASMIRGFRQGVGAALTTYDEEGEKPILGAILVDDAAEGLRIEGGLAEKAGEATAVAGNKAHEAVDKVVKPAAHAAGEAVGKGAYATGRQLSRAKGMFAGFKDEFDKASGKASAPGSSRDLSSREGGSLEVAEMANGDEAHLDDDYEVVYVDEDGNEVVYVDEDGNEVVYVDEDGNAVDIDDDDDVVIVVGASESDAKAQSPSKPTGKSSQRKVRDTEDLGNAVGSHLRKTQGMFSAFKSEFDKARK